MCEGLRASVKCTTVWTVKRRGWKGDAGRCMFVMLYASTRHVQQMGSQGAEVDSHNQQQACCCCAEDPMSLALLPCPLAMASAN